MQVVSVFIAFLAVTSLVVAQSPSGYNYPSPQFNQLTPGAPGDLAVVPGPSVQQPPPQTAFTGSQPGYNNPQFTPSGPPAFGSTTYNPAFVPTGTSTLPAVAGSHSSVPGHHHSSSAGFPSSQSAFPSTAPSSSSFPHSSHSGSHTGGHSGGHSGTGNVAGTSFALPGSPGFSGSSDGSSGNFGGFGGQGAQGGFAQGQSGFGGQSFGPTGSTQFQGQGGDDGSYSGGDYSAIPGTPGVDYPIYTEIPKTSFDCKNQQFPGYYADVEAQCQVFHICALNTTFNFLCPNGTIFSQEHLVCVWWNQFDCNTAQSLYGNNAYIYDYSKTGQQSNAQVQSNNFGSAPDASGFDGSQGAVFGGQSAPGFGASQPASSGFGPSSHSAAHSPSSGFGATSVQPSGPAAFGSQPSAPGFGSTGYPSSSAGVGFVAPAPGFGVSQPAASGFGQPAPSHSSGFGQSHIPSGSSSHSSHSSSHVPSSHSFASPSQSGAEQYPIAPPSQTDYQSPVITPTIPSSPATFGAPTGYPAAGSPSPVNTVLSGEPSREYLPSRRTK